MKLLPVSVLCLSALAAAAAPKIVCDQATHEFGQVANNTKINHTFVLRNDGDEPLRVDRVQPSCGCTVAEISQSVLAPGATAQIPSVLDLNGKRGPMNKMITVYSNDPATPQLRLNLSGVATVDVEVNPMFLFMPSVPYDRVSTGTVSVVANGTNRVSVVEVLSSSPVATATFTNQEDGKGAEIQVRARVAENGPLVNPGRLTIKTNNPAYAELPVDFTFNIIDKITVIPGTMAFSLLTGPNAKPPVSISRILRVRPGTVQEFKVLEALWPEGGKKGQITNLGASGYQVLFENIIPSQELNGRHVILKTDVPGREEIKLPLSIAVYGTDSARVLPQPAPPAPAPEQPGVQ